MNLDLSRGSRERLLAIVILTIMAIFVVRLFYLQIVQHDYYVGLANREQQKQLGVPAARGQIYALDDGVPVPLVMNQATYTVFADPSIIKNNQAVTTMIQEVAGGNARPNLSGLLSNKKSRYVVIATGITRQQAEQMKDRNLLGVGFTKGTQRVYPEGALGSQVLGFVNGEGKGQYGIEGHFDKDLQGTDGMLKTVTDVRDVPLTIGNKNISQPAKNGKNMILTIDRNVQTYAEQALATGMQKSGAKEGSVVVLDPRNGHVMAMANLPTFDPANFNKVTNAADFQNATISLPYEPGSDIKTLTAATGIEKGVITPESTYNNTDYMEVDGAPINNFTKGQTGTITMQKAMNYSLNTGFVTIAQRLGNGSYITRQARDTMYDYFHNRLHLGQYTGIELQGEAEGTIVSPKDVQGNAVRYSNMSFGQGMDATMVQVASAFGTIVNGGTYYYPTVINGTLDDDGAYTPAQARAAEQNVLKPSTANAVREMVRTARTTFYAGTDKPGYYIGGKTGTSQAIVNGTYSDTETIGTYLGFGGEIDQPTRYVVMVRVAGKGQSLAGGTHAMPIFNDLSNWMTSYLKLQPKG